MSEIKPCPFCGSKQLKVDSQRHNFRYYTCKYYKYSVRCNICYARGSVVGGYVPIGGNIKHGINYTTTKELKLKAINAWNNRHE